MTPDEARITLDNVIKTVELLADEIPDAWPDNEALAVWSRLTDLLDLAKIVAYQHGAILAARLPNEYEHPVIGTVHWDTERSEKWDGAGILTELSEPLIDKASGEIIDAVPTAILREVLPAVQPGKTSSKWNKTGLTAAGIQPASYRTVEWGSKVLKRGPKYRRNLAPKPDGDAARSPTGDP